jgi:hypothetical protein
LAIVIAGWVIIATAQTGDPDIAGAVAADALTPTVSDSTAVVFRPLSERLHIDWNWAAAISFVVIICQALKMALPGLIWGGRIVIMAILLGVIYGVAYYYTEPVRGVIAGVLLGLAAIASWGGLKRLLNAQNAGPGG